MAWLCSGRIAATSSQNMCCGINKAAQTLLRNAPDLTLGNPTSTGNWIWAMSERVKFKGPEVNPSAIC